jgi:hypothetical protein
MAGWAHAPHLDEDTKRELLASYPPSEREARTEGKPVLGSGMVFPVPEDQITCDPFAIPPSWPRICGLDFGWDHPAAASWLAWDRDTDTVYVYDCWSAREQTPAQQAPVLIGRGKWIPVAWPHDGLQHDKGSGEQLAAMYTAAGVNMLHERATFEDGTNGVEAGIMDMLARMQQRRWRVFKTCGDWLSNYRTYHRKDGLIVKKKDDVISASRYALMMKRFARVKPSGQGAVIERSYGRSGY